MLKKLALCAVLGAVSTVALAANWIHAGGGRSGESYIDTSTMSRNGDTVAVWTKDVLSNPTEYAYRISRETFDCKMIQGKTGTIIAYDANDHMVISTQSRHNTFEDLPPDSIAASILKTACALSK